MNGEASDATCSRHRPRRYSSPKHSDLCRQRSLSPPDAFFLVVTRSAQLLVAKEPLVSRPLDGLLCFSERHCKSKTKRSCFTPFAASPHGNRPYVRVARKRHSTINGVVRMLRIFLECFFEIAFLPRTFVVFYSRHRQSIQRLMSLLVYFVIEDVEVTWHSNRSKKL